jgi:hypothetical protein
MNKQNSDMLKAMSRSYNQKYGKPPMPLPGADKSYANTPMNKLSMNTSNSTPKMNQLGALQRLSPQGKPGVGVGQLNNLGKVAGQ